MSDKSIYVGECKILNNTGNVSGGYVELENESYYKISKYDQMDPFFMSIVSGSDFWMFVSSTGGITAGRKNPDNALFPYYTDDIIHDSAEKTGSKTLLRIQLREKTLFWEPFSNYYRNIYNISRNLYKNIPGNKILFEEINHDLKLTFQYSWLTSEKYGIVKRSKLINSNKSEIKIEYLDGIQNILPYGIDQQFQNAFSTLADGYKKNELIKEVGIGVFSLSSIPSDKAEPSESLKATTVWSTGVQPQKYLLSSTRLNDFRNGKNIESEYDIKGRRGAYFINGDFSLKPDKSKEWFIISEINQDSSDLAELINLLKTNAELTEKVNSDISAGTEELKKIVAKADGIQLTQDKLGTSRHFANTLFNVMRGGIFLDSYTIDNKDFLQFVQSSNSRVYKKHEKFLIELNNKIDYSNLVQQVSELNDNELTKLAYEYLPISFSRRHGDPSRPWNRFSIDIKDDRNNKLLNYQGNWRDIFQNWEALAESFPYYIESMITKFLNGSTADGYNPYRVTRDGFDWEVPEPDQPWANIGYWGDHQIIYLLKLLELSYNHNSDKLKELINKDIFTYVNVPYRIKKYEDLLRDPHNTVDFDYNLNKKIKAEEKEIGSDARFIKRKDGSLYQVNLLEKLLSPLLAKLSNFIPGGGIWMNTQRPEWNDANNALVGYGISMVTLYYLRRYVNFLIDLISELNESDSKISEEVKIFFNELSEHLYANVNNLESGITDETRKSILDGLGIAGSNFRIKIYEKGFSEKKEKLEIKSVIDFLNTTQKYLDKSIEENKRKDDIYHSYNLMSLQENKLSIINLYEMLEGQVAVLSSGYLQTPDTIKLLDSLRKSELYREDQNSYILYPNRELPQFVEKNIIPAKEFNSSEMLKKFINDGNGDIVQKDKQGNYHFNGEIRNAVVLRTRLKKIQQENKNEITDEDISKALQIYESVFQHKYFTGRSGTFFKYEGLGSIYWHMVSKLLLAVQETYYKAVENGENNDELNKLRKYYYEIKEGIGVHKSPDKYGAFPTDPYSHTPSFAGVQQPGMTGQVKEDFISRIRELGVQVKNGKIVFNTNLLNNDEFLTVEESFDYFDMNGEKVNIQLPRNSLAFTYCQVPVVYLKSDENKVYVYKEGKAVEMNSLELNLEDSQSLFRRDGAVDKIEVYVK